MTKFATGAAFPRPGTFGVRCKQPNCLQVFIAVIDAEDIDDGCTPHTLNCPRCQDAGRLGAISADDIFAAARRDEPPR